MPSVPGPARPFGRQLECEKAIEQRGLAPIKSDVPVAMHAAKLKQAEQAQWPQDAQLEHQIDNLTRMSPHLSASGFAHIRTRSSADAQFSADSESNQSTALIWSCGHGPSTSRANRPDPNAGIRV